MFTTKSALILAFIASSAMAVNIKQDDDTAAAQVEKEEEFHSYLDFCVVCDSFKWNPKDKGAKNPNVNADDTQA